MEHFATRCVCDVDWPTVHEPSRNIVYAMFGLAEHVGIDPEMIRVISSYVGGGFGSQGSMSAPDERP